ncbi:MAG TPA: hypothetical protein VKV32_01275 [Stellaceae bacterium]|nr:hypothetical protein [Stellaceae bacterium]
MRKTFRDEPERWDADWDAERQTKALAGVAFILALAIVGFYLVIHLRAVAKVEDCLLAQQNNCDSLVDSR